MTSHSVLINLGHVLAPTNVNVVYNYMHAEKSDVV